MAWCGLAGTVRQTRSRPSPTCKAPDEACTHHHLLRWDGNRRPIGLLSSRSGPVSCSPPPRALLRWVVDRRSLAGAHRSPVAPERAGWRVHRIASLPHAGCGEQTPSRAACRSRSGPARVPGRLADGRTIDRPRRAVRGHGARRLPVVGPSPGCPDGQPWEPRPVIAGGAPRAGDSAPARRAPSRTLSKANNPWSPSCMAACAAEPSTTNSGPGQPLPARRLTV